jgi:hypothetical protein
MGECAVSIKSRNYITHKRPHPFSLGPGNRSSNTASYIPYLEAHRQQAEQTDGTLLLLVTLWWWQGSKERRGFISFSSILFDFSRFGGGFSTYIKATTQQTAAGNHCQHKTCWSLRGRPLYTICITRKKRRTYIFPIRSMEREKNKKENKWLVSLS